MISAARGYFHLIFEFAWSTVSCNLNAVGFLILGRLSSYSGLGEQRKVDLMWACEFTVREAREDIQWKQEEETCISGIDSHWRLRQQASPRTCKSSFFDSSDGGLIEGKTTSASCGKISSDWSASTFRPWLTWI